MAKKPTAKQIAARKKFVQNVRAGKFRKKKASRKKPAVRKTVRRSRKVVRKKSGIRKHKVRKQTTVASLKGRIRTKLDDQLKDQLFKRDKATTRKQHVAAQNKIDNIRKELRKVN